MYIRIFIIQLDLKGVNIATEYYNSLVLIGENRKQLLSGNDDPFAGNQNLQII